MLLCPQCLSLRATAAPCPRDGATPLDYATALVGRRFGAWLLRAKVSEGGMAIVYAAEHEQLGRLAAIKVLRPELSLREPLVARFLQEARAVSMIGHKNIVAVYDFGRAPGDTSYIVMEYLQGRTLRALLEGGAPLALEGVAAIVEQVGQALAAAHDKGFVHCDVKPENIVVDESGGRPTVKLLDFGIATLLSADPSGAGEGTALGTAPYMAPEQLVQGAVDARTDVYSLGVLSYELLTGRLPFPGTNPASVRRLQAKRAPAPSSRHGRRLEAARAAAVDTAVLRALAIDPDQRYAGVRPFLAALQHALTAPTTGLGKHEPVPVGRAAPRPWLAAGGLALLVALAIALLGPRWLRRPPTPAIAIDPSPRTASSRAKPPPPREPVVSAPAPLTLVREALRRGDATTRAQLLTWIGQLNRRALAPAVSAATTDIDPRVRRSAALALAALRPIPPGTHETLHRLLSAAQGQATQAWLRLDTATALARLGDSAGMAQLERELPSANLWLQVALLEALAHAGQRTGLALARHLRDATPATRAARLGALARLARTSRGRWARQQLLRALQTGAWEERLLAAQALAPLLPGRAQAALRQTLRDGPADVQQRAALQLARDFADVSASPLLRAALQHPTREDDAIAVALALGRLADPEARAALRAVLARPLPQLRLAAAVALIEP